MAELEPEDWQRFSRETWKIEMVGYRFKKDNYAI